MDEKQYDSSEPFSFLLDMPANLRRKKLTGPSLLQCNRLDPVPVTFVRAGFCVETDFPGTRGKMGCAA